MHFSRYTHSIQMLQEVSLKTQMIFPNAPDIYWVTVCKWRVSEEQVQWLGTYRWHVLRKNWTKFELDWTHLQGNHWTHLHSKECDIIIIIITNKIKLMYLHPYKTTMVYKVWQLSAKLNFVNWYLQRVHAGEVNLMLVLFSDEAWFHHSWYAWPLKITLTVMLIHRVPLREVKVWRSMCYKCN